MFRAGIGSSSWFCIAWPEVRLGDGFLCVLQADGVVHGVTQVLFAPEIPFGGFNRYMPQKKLDLLQFSSSHMA